MLAVSSHASTVSNLKLEQIHVYQSKTYIVESKNLVI